MKIFQSTLRSESGQILVVALSFIAVVVLIVMALLGYTNAQIASHRHAVSKVQAIDIAEAGAEMAIWKLNNQGGYTGENNTPFGNGTYSVTVTTIDSNNRNVVVNAHVPNSTNPVASKTVKFKVNTGGSAVSFRYGLQTGTGGFTMSGGSTLNGNIYSNGNINATTGVTITGSAIAANPAALAADQINDTPTPISSCTSSTCITFGNASATEDFAQSFQLSSTTPLNNIQFYIKKVGSPGDLSVKIIADNSGSPSNVGGDLLMAGSLNSSLVTANFGWVTVTMPTDPVLTAGQTYWIVLDGGSHASRYYIIGANNDGYANGAGKIGKQGTSWSNTTPSGLDGYFKVYLGGGYSMIGGNNYTTGVYVGTTSTDEAWAHTVQGATMSGPLYCQTSSYTNKACNTTRPDPPAQPMPLSDSNIQEWKDDAAAGGTITGNYTVDSAGATLGPKKITGNLSVGGGGTLTMTGTIWVEGTITVNGGGKIRLASSYGANSGILITDGYVSLSGGCDFAGSGTAGSYPFLITTSSCPAGAGCNGNNAITLTGGAGTVALIAQEGNVDISGGSSLKQVTAKQVIMDGGATLYYDSGLISENFSSGPGASWEFVRGSYISQ